VFYHKSDEKMYKMKFFCAKVVWNALIIPLTAGASARRQQGGWPGNEGRRDFTAPGKNAAGEADGVLVLEGGSK
jgi:hypothetical protein